MSGTASAGSVHYDITALPMTIWFNRDGDHDHDGMMFALTENVPILKYIEAMAKGGPYRRELSGAS